MNENRDEAQQGIRTLPILAYIAILLAIAPFVYLIVVPWAVEKRRDRTQRQMLELPMKDPLEFPPTTILDLSLLWQTEKDKDKDEEFFIVEIDNSLIVQRFLVKIMAEIIESVPPTEKELVTSGIYADRIKGMLTAVLSKQRVDQVHKPVVKSAITCGVALIGFNIAIRIRKRYISLLLCKLNRDFCKILSKISVIALGFD